MLRAPVYSKNVVPETNSGIDLAYIIFVCALPLLLGITAGILAACLVASRLGELNFPEKKRSLTKPPVSRADRWCIAFMGIDE